MMIYFRSITTKYFGPSNVRGSRIIATASGDGFGQPKIVMPYNHALGVDENHAKAARLLAEKLEWSGKWVMGGAKTGAVFVLVETGNKVSEGFEVEYRDAK